MTPHVLIGVALLVPAAKGEIVPAPTARHRGFESIATHSREAMIGTRISDIVRQRLGDAQSPERTARRRSIAREFRDTPNPLVRREESGRVRPLDRPKEFVAIDLNPLIADEQTRTACRLVIERRVERTLASIVENVDLMVELDRALGRATHDDQTEIDRIRLMIDAVSPEESLGDELDDAGILDERQDAMHWWMVSRYDDALRKDIIGATREDRPQKPDELLRYLLHDQASEALTIYHDALRLAGDHLIEIGAQRPPQIGQMYAEAAVRASQASAEERFEIVRDMIERLPMDEKQELLRGAWELR
ncbi:MAG: hypothetical protein H6811_09185 [Phycisphaeraceae bacterium]|nr:hypothetical protein [Phycisphaeraceae bacterium]